MNEREKCQKKWAITDLNAPNGSRDIPSKSQEFEQDGRRFSASFSRKYDATDATGKIMKTWKCNILAVFCSICLKFCRLLELSKGISLDLKFRCYGN